MTTPRTTPRFDVIPELANGSRAEDDWPDVTVKLVVAPVAVPAAFRNENVPVHEAAVPVDEFEATFVTLISTLSPVPMPMGGK